MFLHDTSDVFLHVAKTFHNASLRRLADLAFVLFAIVFFVTRIVLLPMCPHAYFTGVGDHHSTCGHALAGTCSILVILHCYWFYIIVSMIVRFAKKGQVEGDIREEEVNDNWRKQHEVVPTKQPTKHSTNGHVNGNGKHVITRTETKAE
jgi:uncharacterized membrane protein